MLNHDFKEFIELLNEHDVRYLVVGGYAVAFHGYPRFTKDIDIWIERDTINGERIVASLDEFGFAAMGLTADDFLQPDQIIQLGYPPNRIDLITTMIAIEFDECFAKRKKAILDGVEVRFIDVESLKINKTACGRPQDIADVANLE